MLSIVMLINRSGSMVLPFLGVYMTDHLGFGIKEAGLVLSCFGIGALLGSWIGGYLTDKIGEYKVQTFSLFTSVPLFLMYPFFDTVYAVGGLVLLQSIISEVFRPANSVAITKYSTPKTLTRAFSLNRMAINLGFSIGPAMAGFLAAISYNFLFVFNSFAVLCAGIMYVRFFKSRHKYVNNSIVQTKESENVKATDISITKSAYFDLKFWIYCLFCTFFSICFFQIVNVMPLFYRTEIGLSQSIIGLLMGLNGFVVVIFEMLLVHTAEKRFSLSQTMLYGTVLCAVSYFMIGFHPNILLLALSTSVLSLGEILVLPFMSTITALRSQSHNKGSYMGMNGMSISIAFIISPILGTKLAESYGFSNLWLGTFAILMLTAIGFYFYIPKLIGKKTEIDPLLPAEK